MKKKVLAAVISVVLVGSVLAGCGSSSESVSSAGGANTAVSGNESSAAAEDSDDESTASANGVTEIKVATTGTGPKPYIYTDDNNELTGYDIELLRAIFQKLPQYSLTFIQTDDVFGGLDAGYYDLACNHFGWNKERAEKYIFSDVYSAETHALIIRDDDTEINGLNDLAGHSTEVTASSFNTTLFENYNVEHPDNQIILSYVDDPNTTPLHVSNGTVDFEYFTSSTLHSQVEEQGLTNIRFIELKLEDTDSFSNTVTGEFYIAPQDHQQLIDDINGALEELVADGTVADLAKQYVGDVDVPITQEFINETNEKIANYSE